VTPAQADAVLALTDPDGPVLDVRWFPAGPPTRPSDRPSVLLVTLDGLCEHMDTDTPVPRPMPQVVLALDDWDDGRLRARWLLIGVQDPAAWDAASTTPSGLVAALARFLRATTPDHRRCRAARLVPAVLAVLAAADDWDDDQVRAEQILAALAMVGA
jgi:hypothetical protein